MALAEPEEIKAWLEWAGGKLLSLPLASPAPSGYRTARIDYAPDRMGYGYTAETLRAPRVLAEEIPIMDQILLWPALASEIRVRRILHLRLLVTPISGRHLHDYKSIAKELHIDRRLAARLHLKGLRELTFRIPKPQIRIVRGFLAPVDQYS